MSAIPGSEQSRPEPDLGGYVKPANLKANRRDRRFARNQKGKRKVVVVIRGRSGNSVPAVVKY
jgi:hypothetical protein